MTGSAELTGDPSSIPRDGNPFVGPRPFEAGERLWGRDRELRELDDEIASERVVVLCSPSGAGKSSLVQAGLLPRLAGSFDVWGPTRVNRPPAHAGSNRYLPNRYVLSALVGLEEGVPEALRRADGILAGQTLSAYVENRPRRRSAPRGRLLVFDQFEEVLTVDPLALEAKREFFDQLGQLLRDPWVWALFVLREEYLVALDPYARQVPTHLRNRFRIDLLGRDAALEAMVNPARAAGREFPAAGQLARDLATMKVQQGDGTFVHETGRHVEPVQLQVVCRRLWDALPTGHPSIEARDLRRFGDVTEALAGYYDDSLARVAAGSSRRMRAIRDWFGEALITSGGIRGQVLKGGGVKAEQSDGLADDVVAELLDTHLVRAEKRAGATWYELAHDRLIEPVRESNAAWRAEHLTEVQQRAQVWEQQGRPPGLLAADEELAVAERWAAGAAVTAVERRFLEGSRRAQDVRDRERRQARFISALALVATIGGLVALFQWRAAEHQRVAAVNLTRAAVAAHLLAKGETAAGNLLLLEVRRPGETPTALAALHQALADPVEAVILEGHTNEVRAAAWSPDGERVATASWDDTARVWDAATGEPTAVLEGHGEDLETVAWSPDGRRLATGSKDNTARIWDAATGAALHVLEGHTADVLALAWEPDGRRLATASRDGTVRVWDADTGAAATVLQPPADAADEPVSPNEYLTVAWSPDGRRLAANRGRKVVVWRLADSPSATVLANTVLVGHTDDVLALAWSPDSRRLASAGADWLARIWDTAATAGGVLLEGRALLEGHADWVADVAWSPDGRRLATASLDGTARVWDAVTGQATARLEGHQDFLWSVSWSPDGRWLVTSSEDATVRLWRPSGGPAVALLAGHGGQVRGAAWDPAGGRLLTASSDRSARIWKPLQIGEEVTTLWGHGDEVFTAAWSPDGDRVSPPRSPPGDRAVTASWDRTARVWDLAGGGETARLSGHTDGVTTAAWSPDGGRIATASWDTTARIWDARTGESLVVLAGHTKRVWDVEWSPEGSRVATASWDYTARIWDPASGEVLFSLAHREKVMTVAWRGDGSRILTAVVDDTARIWDARTGAALAVLEGHENTVYTAAWSPDGGRVLTISKDGTGRIWDAANGAAAAVLRGHTDEVRAAAWSPDGARVLTGSWDRTARLWDARTGDQIAVLEGHTDGLESVAWSPDGERAATAGHDRTVRVWDAGSGEQVAVLEGHRAVVSTAAWSGDGSRLLSASDDGTARVWAVSERYPDYLRGRIRGRLRRCLDPAFYPRHLGLTDAEARRRHDACEACVPRFFERLGGAPPWQWQAYEAAWQVYEGCFAGRL